MPLSQKEIIKIKFYALINKRLCEYQNIANKEAQISFYRKLTITNPDTKINQAISIFTNEIKASENFIASLNFQIDELEKNLIRDEELKKIKL